MVGQWLALLPHTWVQCLAGAFLCGVCLFFPGLHGFQLILQSLPLTKVLAQKTWFLGTTLLLPTAPQGLVKCRDRVLLYTVYVTSKVPLLKLVLE